MRVIQQVSNVGTIGFHIVFFLPKEKYYAKHTIYYRHTNTLDVFNDGEIFTQQCYVHGPHLVPICMGYV